MIDEKKIEEVASKDSAFLYSEWNTPCKEAYVRGFKACMHWLRQSLWHDASERHNDMTLTLCGQSKGVWIFAISQLKNGIAKILALLINGLIWQTLNQRRRDVYNNYYHKHSGRIYMYLADSLLSVSHCMFIKRKEI